MCLALQSIPVEENNEVEGSKSAGTIADNEHKDKEVSAGYMDFVTGTEETKMWIENIFGNLFLLKLAI